MPGSPPPPAPPAPCAPKIQFPRGLGLLERRQWCGNGNQLSSSCDACAGQRCPPWGPGPKTGWAGGPSPKAGLGRGCWFPWAVNGVGTGFWSLPGWVWGPSLSWLNNGVGTGSPMAWKWDGYGLLAPIGQHWGGYGVPVPYSTTWLWAQEPIPRPALPGSVFVPAPQDVVAHTAVPAGPRSGGPAAPRARAGHPVGPMEENLSQAVQR